MNSRIEIQEEGQNPDEQVDPRDQFIRQVDDESRPAPQVLKEQMHGGTTQDAARLFVP